MSNPERVAAFLTEPKALRFINADYKVLSDSDMCYHEEMKQIITRVDDDLADALKHQARRRGESVNSYINRLLRVAVAGPGTHRHDWKVAAISNGRLISRNNPTSRSNDRVKRAPVTKLRTPSGYVSSVVSHDRDKQ